MDAKKIPAYEKQETNLGDTIISYLTDRFYALHGSTTNVQSRFPDFRIITSSPLLTDISCNGYLRCRSSVTVTGSLRTYT